MTADDNELTSALRHALTDALKGRGAIKTPSVEAAFHAVPRHLFVSGAALEEAYSDQSIPTKLRDGVAISSSSQPAIMALMLEQLDLRPGHRVLEIGAGTGYNAALMAHIVGGAGLVVTVDIDDDIVEGARDRLSAAGYEGVRVVRGDGALGYPEYVPYDRIILTVGAPELASAWVKQLADNGRLVLPLGLRGPQVSVAFEAVGGHLESVSVEGCGFMPLRGSMSGSRASAEIAPGLTLVTDERLHVDAGTIGSWLGAGGRDIHAGVQVRRDEGEMWGLELWLSLREAGVCRLSASGEAAEAGTVPCLFEYSSGGVKRCYAFGLIDSTGLGLLDIASQASPSCDYGAPDSPGPSELFVRRFGSDESAVRKLIGQIGSWDAAGRPGLKGLRIRAYSGDDAHTTVADEMEVPGSSYQLVLGWRGDNQGIAGRVR